jgi:hypothetical protein
MVELDFNDYVDVDRSFSGNSKDRTEVPFNLDQFFLKQEGRDKRGYKFYSEFGEELIESTGLWSWGYKFNLKMKKTKLGELKGNLRNINTVQIFDNEKRLVASFIKRNTNIEHEKENKETSWLVDRVIGVVYSNSEPLLIRLMGEIPPSNEFPRSEAQNQRLVKAFFEKIITNKIHIDVVNTKNESIAKINMEWSGDIFDIQNIKFNVDKKGPISPLLLVSTSLLSSIFLRGFLHLDRQTAFLFYNNPMTLFPDYQKDSLRVEAGQEYMGEGSYTIVRDTFLRDSQKMILLESDVRFPDHVSDTSQLVSNENQKTILTSYGPSRSLNLANIKVISLKSKLLIILYLITLVLLISSLPFSYEGKSRLIMINRPTGIFTFLLFSIFILAALRKNTHKITNPQTLEGYYNILGSKIMKFKHKEPPSFELFSDLKTTIKIKGKEVTNKKKARKRKIKIKIINKERDLTAIYQADPKEEKRIEGSNINYGSINQSVDKATNQLEKVIVYDDGAVLFTITHERLFTYDNSLGNSLRLLLDIPNKKDLAYIFAMAIIIIRDCWSYQPRNTGGGGGG